MSTGKRASPSEKESLLEALLPEPTHPRSTRRAFSLGVISVFLLLVVYLAATDTQTYGVDLELLEEGFERASSLGDWVYPQGKPGKQNDSEELDDIDMDVLEQEEQYDEQDYNVEDAGSEEEDADAASLAPYTKYTWHKDLEWDADGPGRLIIVGDVHGMVDALKELLSELDYSNVTSPTHSDTLVFVGDLVAKHPSIQKSLDTVDYIRSLGAWAVRGNHDQDTINFRSYIESSPTLLSSADAEGDTAPETAPAPLKHKWRDEHYRIAKAMSQEAATWMAEQSLTLHIRSLHAYIVHAGLLPWTIPKNTKKHKHYHTSSDSVSDEAALQDALEDLSVEQDYEVTDSTDLEQSASASCFVPINGVASTSPLKPGQRLNTSDPELAILTSVKGNRDPFTLLNMRGVKKNGKVTKNGKKGRAWAPIWNAVMASCEEKIKTDGEQTGTSISSEPEQRQATSDKRKMRKVPKHRERADRPDYKFGKPVVEDDAEEPAQQEENKAGDEATIREAGTDVSSAAVNTNTEAEAKKNKKKIVCRPLNVIYGHAAARGLDLREWSIGLDSGAVYGRSLSALVIEGSGADAHPYAANKRNKLNAQPVKISGRSAVVYSLETNKP